MAIKKTEKDGFVANIDTANEEITRLTGELATAVEANGVAVKAAKDVQTKFEADLKVATDKADADLKAANEKAAADLKTAVDKATADGEAKGKKDVVAACAAAGVQVPAQVEGRAEVDDSKVKTAPTATGLQRAINANIEAQQKS